MLVAKFVEHFSTFDLNL